MEIAIVISFMYPDSKYGTDYTVLNTESGQVIETWLRSEPKPTSEALFALYPQAKAAASKSSKWNAIKAERDRRVQNGGYKVGTKWFHSDTFSRTQQMGLVMMGASIPAGTPWKTMDGSTVTMTQTLAGQIFATAAGSDLAIFAAAETHRVAMEASADPASYDFSAGWPKAFGE